MAALAVMQCLVGWVTIKFVCCVKVAKDTAIGAMECEQKPYPSFRMAPFVMTDPKLHFRVSMTDTVARPLSDS